MVAKCSKLAKVFLSAQEGESLFLEKHCVFDTFSTLFWSKWRIFKAFWDFWWA